MLVAQLVGVRCGGSHCLHCLLGLDGCGDLGGLLDLYEVGDKKEDFLERNACRLGPLFPILPA